ncbi:MAG: hypothetical protein C0596_01070 [Marinilabiliales bacterium]|nr:MAG: hypothetical protein C0596_01070 [Marinilabiliales bacterium]
MKKVILLLSGIILYQLSIAQWTPIGADIIGEAAFDYSGQAISLNSDATVIAIGSKFNKGAISPDSPGHVRVYELSGGNWVQKGPDIDGVADDDAFGTSVALSDDGNTLIVGIPGESSVASSNGQAIVYEYSGGVWVQKGNSITGAAAYATYGQSVDISADGNTVIIGTPGDPGDNYGGTAKVYEYSGSAWDQKGNTVQGDDILDQLGMSVSINDAGTIIASGAPGGAYVKVFEYNSSSEEWDLMGLNIADGTGTFGNTIALNEDGETIICGDAEDAMVAVYNYTGSVWVQMGSDIQSTDTTDLTGTGVAICASGNIIAVGAPGSDISYSNAGHVMMYQYSGSNWTLIGSGITGFNPEDKMGTAVALSENGAVMAVSAPSAMGNAEADCIVQVYENPTIGIKIFGSETNIEIYPNPTSDYLNINLGDMQNEAIDYKLVNQLGQIVNQGELNSSYCVIDLNDFESGMYLLIIGNDSYSVSIVK